MRITIQSRLNPGYQSSYTGTLKGKTRFVTDCGKMFRLDPDSAHDQVYLTGARCSPTSFWRYGNPGTPLGRLINLQ